MRKSVWVVLAGLSAGGLSVGAGCSLFQKKHTPPPQGDVRHILLKDTPKPLAKGIVRDFPGSTIDQIDETLIDGYDQYTVYITTRAGEHRIVRYDDGGNALPTDR